MIELQIYQVTELKEQKRLNWRRFKSLGVLYLAIVFLSVPLNFAVKFLNWHNVQSFWSKYKIFSLQFHIRLFYNLTLSVCVIYIYVTRNQISIGDLCGNSWSNHPNTDQLHYQGTSKLVPSSCLVNTLRTVGEAYTAFWWRESSPESYVQLVF
jgi:hypothetical protein